MIGEGGRSALDSRGGWVGPEVGWGQALGSQVGWERGKKASGEPRPVKERSVKSLQIKVFFENIVKL